MVTPNGSLIVRMIAVLNYLIPPNSESLAAAPLMSEQFLGSRLPK
jgi:hypothetical protein